jgi:phenylpyruvate tautomerase
MPYFNIETNQPIDATSSSDLMKKATGFLAGMMGKPEHVIMVTIKTGMPYLFGGTDEPTAYVQIKAVALVKDKCPEYSKQVCDFLEDEIGVPADRVFIEFIDIDPKIFGFNGSTLAS